MEIHRYVALLATLLLGILPCAAQNETIAGRIVDKADGGALDKATLQLYELKTSRNRRDTTYVAGTLTDEDGFFTFNSVKNGTYLIKASFVGYKEWSRRVTKVSGQALSLGEIDMESDAILLDGATVVANIPKMVIKDDTVVYNADAFRVPEGSVIEALVEALPGAKIDDDGGVTINGKNVKRFKMDGRDFMTGNNSAVMKNLPSYVIEQVKAYDEKSDLSRLTGLDDGNDDFVLEFVTKRSARNGLQMNPDIGIGTDHRYGIRSVHHPGRHLRYADQPRRHEDRSRDLHRSHRYRAVPDHRPELRSGSGPYRLDRADRCLHHDCFPDPRMDHAAAP